MAWIKATKIIPQQSLTRISIDRRRILPDSTPGTTEPTAEGVVAERRAAAAEVPEEKEARLDRQRGVDGVVQLDQRRRRRREEPLGRRPRPPRPQWQERQSRARPHAAPAQLGTGRIGKSSLAQWSKLKS